MALIVSTEGEFVSLARTPRGKLFRKQILRRGTLKYPGVSGGKIVVDDTFLTTMLGNYEAGVCPIVQVPLADKDNHHTEAPERNIGEVVGLEITPEGLDAIVDIRKHGDDVGKTILGASAQFAMDYTDTKTGEKVGPTLLHVCATNRPFVTDLNDFGEIVAASADDLGEPTLLTLEQDKITGDPAVTIEELIAKLKTEDAAGNAALITSLEKTVADAAKVPDLETKATEAEDQGKVLAALTSALETAGIVKLSAGADGKPDASQVAGAVAQLAVDHKATQDQVAELVKLSAGREVDDLIQAGRILPAQKEAMVSLAMTDRKTFEAIVPEKPVVNLTEAGVTTAPVPGKESEDAALVELEIARLTAPGGAAADYVGAKG